MSRAYFQFPLCALRLEDNEKERLDCIISFCLIELGKKIWGKLSESQQRTWRERPIDESAGASNLDRNKSSHLYALLGAQKVGCTLGHVPSLVRRHARLDGHVRDFENRNGRDVLVRVAKELVFEARDRNGISYKELAVLCAIYSTIGASKRPVRITREFIWLRAHGLKSEAVFHKEHPLRTDTLRSRQIRSIIEHLHERRFYARITIGRRLTYYSNRLTQEQLEEAVFRLRVRAPLARQKRIHANKALTQRIREACGHPATLLPLSPHSGAAPAATDVPLK